MKKVWHTLILLAFFAGCISSLKPAEVAQKFFTALQQKNFSEAEKYATIESYEVLEKMADFAVTAQTENIDEAFTVKNVQINGDYATAELVPDNRNIGITLDLIKENGEWKVAFDIKSVLKMAKDEHKVLK